MDNLEAINLWRAWVEHTSNSAAGIRAAESPKVDAWFAADGERASPFFHCFAKTGRGSLLAVHSSKGGRFDDGPVVHLGHRGDVFVAAPNVESALALFAAAGRSYEQALSGDQGLALDRELAGWLRKTFEVRLPKSVVRAVRAASKRHGPAVRRHLASLDGEARRWRWSPPAEPPQRGSSSPSLVPSTLPARTATRQPSR